MPDTKQLTCKLCWQHLHVSYTYWVVDLCLNCYVFCASTFYYDELMSLLYYDTKTRRAITT